jgi:galactokinase
MGTLLNESHESLCKLYEVCTPQVRRLVEVIRADAQVYGARLMGGGFGGNVLALTTAGNVESLIDHVQREFYGPQDRDGVNESAVMVSTPGDGLSVIEP